MGRARNFYAWKSRLGGKKKNLAQARHRRDCSACAKFTRLATGGETGYWWVDALHIYIYQCRLIFRQADDVTTTCLNLCFLMWNVAFHTYSFIAAWFSDRLFPEPLRGKVMFSLNLLHSGVFRIYYYDQCSSIFRRAWNANRSRSFHISDLHIHQCGLVFRQAFFRSRHEAGWCFLWYAMVHYIQLHDHCSPIFRRDWNTAPVSLLWGSRWSYLLHCQLPVAIIWFGKRDIPWLVVTVCWCTSNSALRITR